MFVEIMLNQTVKTILIFDEFDFNNGFSGPYTMDAIPFESLYCVLDPIIDYLECIDELDDDYIDEF